MIPKCLDFEQAGFRLSLVTASLVAAAMDVVCQHLVRNELILLVSLDLPSTSGLVDMDILAMNVLSWILSSIRRTFRIRFNKSF